MALSHKLLRPDDAVPAPTDSQGAARHAPAWADGTVDEGRARSPAPVQAKPQHVDPEAHAENVAATVWLHRELPDPTPPSLRLAPTTASRLHSAAKTRASTGPTSSRSCGPMARSRRRPPAGRRSRRHRRLAALRDSSSRWDAALAYTGRTAAADQAVALARYYRAVGLQTLVDGLLARKEALQEKVLNDDRVQLYAGGRDDVEAGRIDVRVLALVEYLAESYGPGDREPLRPPPSTRGPASSRRTPTARRSTSPGWGTWRSRATTAGRPHTRSVPCATSSCCRPRCGRGG